MNKYILPGIIVVLALVVAIFIFSPAQLGSIRNITDTFINGIVVGSAEEGGCIKIRNSDNDGWGYLYFDGDTGYVTASTSVPFTGACGGL